MSPPRFRQLILFVTFGLVLTGSGTTWAENAVRYSDAQVAPGDSFDVEMIMSNDLVISGAVIPFRWSSPDLMLTGITIIRDRFRGVMRDHIMSIDSIARTSGVYLLTGIDQGNQGRIDPGSGTLALLHFVVSPSAVNQVALIDSVFEPSGGGFGHTQYSDFTGLRLIYPAVYPGHIVIGNPIMTTISVEPGSLTFAGTIPGFDPVSQTLSITTENNETINWQATWNNDWLTVSPSSGTTPETITAGVRLAGLAVGTYRDTIVITALHATNSPVRVPVELTIEATSIELEADPATLTLQGNRFESTPIVRTVQLLATGNTPVDWTAAWREPWLTVVPSSGSTPVTMTVEVDLSALDIGTYADSILITSSEAVNSPLVVPVRLSVDSVLIDTTGQELLNTLLQNGPNPFILFRQTATVIRFKITEAGPVDITVYDGLGRLVRTLVSGPYGTGEQSVEWDGRDAHGNIVPSGHYFYRMTTSQGTVAKQMIFVK